MSWREKPLERQRDGNVRWILSILLASVAAVLFQTGDVYSTTGLTKVNTNNNI
jgi:hypothetical protein